MHHTPARLGFVRSVRRSHTFDRRPVSVPRIRVPGKRFLQQVRSLALHNNCYCETAAINGRQSFFFFFRYGYVCPATYNKADYVVSILNSSSVLDKQNVKTMCDLSSTVAQMNTKYNAFNKDVRCDTCTCPFCIFVYKTIIVPVA